jgi:hypothetical protein
MDGSRIVDDAASSEESWIQCDRGFWPDRNSRGIGMARVDHDIDVTTGRDNGRHKKKRRPLPFDPNTAEGLRDRGIQRIVPTWMRIGIELLAGNIVRDIRLNKSSGAWGCLAISVHKDFEQADREGRARIDRRQPWRTPALTKQARSLTGPYWVPARGYSNKAKRHRLESQSEL